MHASTFSASLHREEAVMRFPYDERLRKLLRAIPGRRWDPTERAWCVPLGPDQAYSLDRLLACLPGEPDVSPELRAAITRRRRRRPARRCFLDLARPDHDWWLSFTTDLARGAVATLLGHPAACEHAETGRGLIPVDEVSAALLDELRERAASDGEAELDLVLSAAAARAMSALRGRDSDRHGGRGDTEPGGAGLGDAFDAVLRRDRRGAHWIVFAGAGAEIARGLAGRCGLRLAEGAAGAVGVAAVEHDGPAIGELLAGLDAQRVQPAVAAWVGGATEWRGTVDVDGPSSAPVFLLHGDRARLPRRLRELSVAAAGGARVPITACAWALIEGLQAWVTPAARRCAAALAEGRPPPPAVLELSGAHEQPTFVLAPGHAPDLAASFAAIAGAQPGTPGRGGREHVALPSLRADPFCVPDLDGFLRSSAAWVDPAALERLQEIREEHARGAGLVALSGAASAELAVPGLGGELKPFQRAGVRYLLERRRAFLADEQGLGKTIEAIAAIEAAAAYPAVVVCPASLKLNWLGELARWLPQRSARALAGTGARTGASVGASAGGGEAHAEVTVVNYEILAARLDQLRALAPKALVVDESHYCKNAAAKRTQAVEQLACAVEPQGLVLALTGTPVTNRPAELIAQLRILGRLEEFGTGAGFGERFRGPDAHLRLHWHLRARCFVRRRKAEVLPQLPPKTRAIVPVELDNEAEYRLAERDVIAWLASQPLDLRELDARVGAALRAERLVRLGALKLIAARGKLHAARTWIHDFCASGEPLVVFARHREIQRALIDHFPDALHILGEDRPAERDLALRRFQAGEGENSGLIVCSLEVAGQGLTLTRASNVAFLELDWTPARHDQAEDRCHRIGQRDAVNVYYLLAAGTVDESIAALLERKRSVIGAVTDGHEQDEESVVEQLVRELRGAPYRHLRAVA